VRSRNKGGRESKKRLTLNFIGSGLEHFSEVIAERMTLLEVLAARFNNDSRIIRRVRLEVLDRIASTLEPAP
jgi:hypothetical protein